jgi:outer membrane protein TolC
VQDSVLAAVDSAAATCRITRRELFATDSLLHTTGEQLALAQAAYQRGEIGMTEIALARLAVVRARRTHDQAAQHALASGAALEGATGLWLSGPPIEWQDIIFAHDSSATSRASLENPH